MLNTEGRIESQSQELPVRSNPWPAWLLDASEITSSGPLMTTSCNNLSSHLPHCQHPETNSALHPPQSPNRPIATAHGLPSKSHHQTLMGGSAASMSYAEWRISDPSFGVVHPWVNDSPISMRWRPRILFLGSVHWHELPIPSRGIRSLAALDMSSQCSDSITCTAVMTGPAFMSSILTLHRSISEVQALWQSFGNQKTY